MSEDRSIDPAVPADPAASPNGRNGAGPAAASRFESALRRASSSDDERYRLSDRDYRRLVEQIPDYAIYFLDIEGRNASWNAGVQQVLGWEREEFLGRPTTELFTPEDLAQQAPARELAEARERGRALDDRWLLRRDGTRFFANGITSALHDERGALAGYSKVIRDGTAARQVEEALRRSEEQLRVALWAAGMGTWHWEIATDTQTFDESLERLFGYTPGESGIRTLQDFLDRLYPEDRATVSRAIRRSLEEDADFNVEFRVVCPDGTLRWLRDQGKVIRDEEGVPLSMAGACVDITERREAEDRVRQAQRMEAVGQLAGGVAHEVNNMLQGITGFSDLLLQTMAPDDPQRSDLEQIRKAAGRAATVTGQLLAFSRRQMLRPEVLDLTTVVATLEPMLRRLLGEDRQLVIAHAAGLGRTRADQGQLEQVLINLAINARDAMPRGGRLTIETRNVTLDLDFFRRHPEVEPRAGPYVALVVSDTGQGMDEATRRRVFEPFFTTKPTGQGTGLGLATVYGIVKQSGGYVWVESTPGEGATFEIYLPRERTGEEVPPTTARDELTEARTTILVVEDEDIVRAWTSRVLRREGYVCLEAHDAAEALRIAEIYPSRLDLVITDIVMPQMSGGELARRLTELRPDLPLLFMSGYTDDEVARRGLLDPGQRLLQKPFGADELLDAVGQRLQERRDPGRR